MPVQFGFDLLADAQGVQFRFATKAQHQEGWRVQGMVLKEGISGLYSLEIYRVEEPVVHGSCLLVTYESADPKQVPERAWRIISDALLRDFLGDRYRGRVEEVVYRQGETGLSVGVPYG